jgi:L-asparagine transporter-like permease
LTFRKVKQRDDVGATSAKTANKMKTMTINTIHFLLCVLCVTLLFGNGDDVLVLVVVVVIVVADLLVRLCPGRRGNLVMLGDAGN